MAKKADRVSDAEMVGVIAEKGVEREKIAEIEGAIARADKKRKENAEIEGNLATELASREAKLNEVMHAHYDELEDEEDASGNKLRVYRRGDFQGDHRREGIAEVRGGEGFATGGRCGGLIRPAARPSSRAALGRAVSIRLVVPPKRACLPSHGRAERLPSIGCQ